MTSVPNRPDLALVQVGDIVRVKNDEVSIPRRSITLFWSKVHGAGVESCWEWKGEIGDNGYGRFAAAGRRHLAHRLAWQLMHGVLPRHLQLDHTCRNRACVNPWHLDPVTGLENNRRGTSPSALNRLVTNCPMGHPYDAENTYEHDGQRLCKECRRIACRRYRARKRRTVS